MKTTLLLPNGFKKIGWAIFVPAFLLGCSICFFGENFDRWLFRETVMNNIAIIGTVVGALFIGYSCTDADIDKRCAVVHLARNIGIERMDALYYNYRVAVASYCVAVLS